MVSWQNKDCGILPKENVGRQINSVTQSGGTLNQRVQGHEENFLSSWLRDDTEGNYERKGQKG